MYLMFERQRQKNALDTYEVLYTENYSQIDFECIEFLKIIILYLFA